MGDLVRCNLCQRFDKDGQESMVLCNCPHMLHKNCVRRWSMLVGSSVRCILCLNDRSKLADGPRKCPSCKTVFQTKEEIANHVYSEHDQVACTFCDFVYMRHQIDNHIDHFCQGPRCGICMDLCTEDKSSDSGDHIHERCLESWNQMSIKCILSSNDAERVMCPIYKCGMKLKYINWNDHMIKKHKGSRSSPPRFLSYNVIRNLVVCLIILYKNYSFILQMSNRLLQESRNISVLQS